MGIKRAALEFEANFTRIPNDWARDPRLSLRARGLLVVLMSHQVGWIVTVESLVKTNPEGRDAIRNALSELRERGYLRVVAKRNESTRQLAGQDYVLTVPNPVLLKISSTENQRDEESDTKKNIPLEDQELEPPLFCSKHPNGGNQCGPCKDAKRINEKWLRTRRTAPIVPRITRPKVCEHERPLGECEYCEQVNAA